MNTMRQRLVEQLGEMTLTILEQQDALALQRVELDKTKAKLAELETDAVSRSADRQE